MAISGAVCEVIKSTWIYAEIAAGVFKVSDLAMCHLKLLKLTIFATLSLLLGQATHLLYTQLRRLDTFHEFQLTSAACVCAEKYK